MRESFQVLEVSGRHMGCIFSYSVCLWREGGGSLADRDGRKEMS